MRLPDRSMTGIKSSMPTEGTAHVLVLAVEFPDKKFDVDIKTVLEENMFGEENKTDEFYPYESVRAYYERSSFGKFSLSGDVYTFIASKDREQYEGKQNELIYEIFDSYRSKILKSYPDTKDKNQYFNDELTKYDQNGDKTIDGIYFYVAGGTSINGSIIKHCSGNVGFCNDLSMGDYKVGSFCYFALTDVNAICHETGHMLGLDDYCANAGGPEAGIAGNDMMNNAQGDHAAFSKILLGWIGQEQIQLITTFSREVQLSDISKEGQCAVIVPEFNERTGLLTKFLMMDYLNNTGNNDNSTYKEKVFLNNKGGVRIYKVDAALDSTGKFLRDVKSCYSEGKAPLIRQVHADEEQTHIVSSTNWLGGKDAGGYADFIVPENYRIVQGLDGCLFHEGDELTPQSLPSSSFYDENLNFVYSGIYVKNIRQNGSKISFMAGKENTIGYSVISTTENTYSSTDDPQIELQLSCDISPADISKFTLSGNMYYSRYGIAYIQDKKGKKINDMQVNVSTSKSGQLTVKKLPLDQTRLEKDRAYEIVIPKGTLKDSSGNILNELKIDFSTKTKYKMYDDFYITEKFTDTVRCIDENGSGILLANKESSDQSHIMGIMYIIENYKIAEEVLCSDEFIQKIMGTETEMWDMWDNADGTWTVLLRLEENELRCVTFDNTGEIHNSYDFKVAEHKNFPYGVGKNMGYAISDDQAVYRLKADSCEKLLKPDEDICNLRMAEDGSFVFENCWEGDFEFYDAEARLMNSINLERLKPIDCIVRIGTFIKCSTGYLMSAWVYNDPMGVDQKYIVWQFDENFKLIKDYLVPGNFNRMLEWENGYIGGFGSTVYLMDFEFHLVDVLEKVTDDYFCGGKIQMKPDGNLFVGWEGDDWKECGFTIDLSSYDDSTVEHIHFLSDNEKPCEAGGRVEISFDMTASEYERESGYKNVNWYYLNEGYITNETYMEISTEDGSYTEYFYFDVKIPTVTPTPDPTATPTPDPIATPTPDPTASPTPDPLSTPPSEVTPSPSPPVVPAQKPNVTQTLTPASSSQLILTVSPSVVPSATPKAAKLMKPLIKVTTQKYRKNMRIANIRLKKYQGTYIEIYYRRGKGKFKKIKLRQYNIKNNKKLFKIGYRKGRKNIYIRVRTYQKKGGKKVYSPYSKSWRVR